MPNLNSDHHLSEVQWIKNPVEQAVDIPEKALTYADYLTDSLNPARQDSLFTFELKAITFSSDSLSESVTQTKYPSFILTESSTYRTEGQIKRREVNHDWITLLLLLGIGLLAWVRYYNPRRLKQIFLATFAKRYIGQLVRDGNIIRERISPALALITTISHSTILYGFAGKFVESNLSKDNPVKAFFIIAAGITLFWFFRRGITNLTGFIFRSRTATELFQLNNLLFTITSGVVLLPLAIGWFFTRFDYLLYAGGGLIVISMIVRLYRNLFGGMQVQSFSGLYFFLYFCTLEILPLAIGFKLFKILSW